MSESIEDFTVSLPRLMTQKQVAQYLGKSEKSLERERWAGTGAPFVKVGRLVRYKSDDVLAWLEANIHTKTIPTKEAN